MPLEFNSINNLASSLSRNRFQRLGKYVATLTRFSTGMRTAAQANGFTSRGFNDLFSIRVENVKIPDQNMFTSCQEDSKESSTHSSIRLNEAEGKPDFYETSNRQTQVSYSQSHSNTNGGRSETDNILSGFYKQQPKKGMLVSYKNVSDHHTNNTSNKSK